MLKVYDERVDLSCRAARFDLVELYQEEKDVRKHLGAATYDVNLTIADVLTKLNRTPEAEEILKACKREQVETAPDSSDDYETIQ